MLLDLCCDGRVSLVAVPIITLCAVGVKYISSVIQGRHQRPLSQESCALLNEQRGQPMPGLPGALL
jgi:hypothetical protein